MRKVVCILLTVLAIAGIVGAIVNLFQDMQIFVYIYANGIPLNSSLVVTRHIVIDCICILALCSALASWWTNKFPLISHIEKKFLFLKNKRLSKRKEKLQKELEKLNTESDD